MGRKKKYITEAEKRVAACEARMRYYYRKKAKATVRGVGEMKALYEGQSDFKYTSEQLADRILEEVQRMIAYAVDARDKSVTWNCLILTDNPKPDAPKIVYNLDAIEIEMVKDVLLKQGYDVEVTKWEMHNENMDITTYMRISGWAIESEQQLLDKSVPSVKGLMTEQVWGRGGSSSRGVSSKTGQEFLGRILGHRVPTGI